MIRSASATSPVLRASLAGLACALAFLQAPLLAVTVTATYNFQYGVNAVAWNPNGGYLACGGRTATGQSAVQVLAFNGNTLTLVAQTGSAIVRSLAWSPDGDYLAVATEFGGSNPTMQVYKFSPDGPVLTLHSSVMMMAAMNSVTWSPDGSTLAVGGTDKRISVFAFGAEGLTFLTQYDLAIASLLSLDWLPGGNRLAAADSMKTLRTFIFDGTNLTLLSQAAAAYPVNSLAWSPDGATLAAAVSRDVALYSPDLVFQRSITLPATAYGVAWSPWTGWFAAGTGIQPSGNEVLVLRFDGSSILIEEQGNYVGIVYAVDWTPDGCKLAVGGTASGAEVTVFTFDGDGDCDGILADGDGSGTAGDHPCACNLTADCDDNNDATTNPTQCPSEVGGRVWMDESEDGLRQWGEPGRPGVTVNLLGETGGFLQTTVTAGYGRYTFGVSVAGYYRVEFVPPSGTVLTAPDQTMMEWEDSDADPVTGQTPLIFLIPYDYSNHITDAGLIAGCPPPDQPLSLSKVAKSADGARVVLNFTDPNLPGRRTGYRVRRSADPSLPMGTWPIIGDNIPTQPLTMEIQWEEETASPGTWFYQVTAYHGVCDTEGPF